MAGITSSIEAFTVGRTMWFSDHGGDENQIPRGCGAGGATASEEVNVLLFAPSDASSIALSVDRLHHRSRLSLPLAESVKLVNPAARLIPIARSTDNGCRTILLREPPIRTLAPKPGPNATLALAPT
jgi:hypothetical protein